MRKIVTAIALLIIISFLNLSVFSQAMAVEIKPIIHVKPPPSRDFPLEIYVLPSSCPDHRKLETMFYDALRDLRKTIMRFANEYPEYSSLLEISFKNVSRPNDAVITFSPADHLEGYIAYTNYTGFLPHYKPGIYVVCDILRRGTEEWARGVIMHELLHALGLGHAWQDQTDDGKPEIMRYVPADIRERVYPSTLDLYGLYVSYFDFHFQEFYNNVTLPDGMPYVMVVPYDVEVQRLREANERLRSEVDDLWRWLRQANDVIKEFEEANRNLSRENAELRAINEALQEQLAETWAELQLTKQVLEHYEEENQVLKQRLLDVAQVGLTMAQRFNETMVELIRENSMLKANLTAALEYARSMETSFNFLRAAVLILCAAALTFVILYLRTMERREAEEEEMPPERQR